MKIRLILLLLLCLGLLGAVEIPQNIEVVPISVSLTGFVESPGVYQLSPLNRLSDIFTLSKGMELVSGKELKLPEQPTATDLPVVSSLAPGDKPDEAEKPDYLKIQALRSVQIIRGGKRETYDLLRFYRLGDLQQNPYLKDGDVVLVSAIQSFVSISGGVNLPEDMEFVAGDKLADVIALAKGFTYDADSSRIQLYRFGTNRIDYEVKSLDLKANPAMADYLIQPDDRIMIPRDSEINTRQRVKISGQVKYPGEYVVGKTTTLYDLIQQAGGITSRGDLKSMVYYSENISSEPNPYLEQLMQRSMSDMTPLEYAYLRTSLLQLKGKYSIDAVKLAETSGKEANPTLHSGDYIYIPEKIDMVWVSGQVRHPGLVPWIEGKDWDYYIAQAGGYSNNRKAGKGRLIRGQSGNWVKPTKNIAIRPGDTVFVPSQTDRSLWVDVKDIVTLVSSLITIIVGLRALSTN